MRLVQGQHNSEQTLSYISQRYTWLPLFVGDNVICFNEFLFAYVRVCISVWLMSTNLLPSVSIVPNSLNFDVARLKGTIAIFQCSSSMNKTVNALTVKSNSLTVKKSLKSNALTVKSNGFNGSKGD